MPILTKDSPQTRELLTKAGVPFSTANNVMDLPEVKMCFNKLHTARDRECQIDLLDRLARAAEERHEGTGSHLRRISLSAGTIGQHLDLDKKTFDNIFIGAISHDLGKMGIEDAILLKPGKLTAEERKRMQKHTLIGGNMLLTKDGREPLLTAYEIAVFHHEWMNGTGYPYGLSDRQIPQSARIVAVVDVADALWDKRPYKEPWTNERVFEFIHNGSGTQFDPMVVEAFFAKKDEILRIQHDNRGNGVLH